MLSEAEIRDQARMIITGNKAGNYDYKWCLGMVAGFAFVLGYNSTEEFVKSLEVA